MTGDYRHNTSRKNPPFNSIVVRMQESPIQECSISHSLDRKQLNVADPFDFPVLSVASDCNSRKIDQQFVRCI